jgi:pimeloyl-ACP methyl ester carboxylesterase
LLKAHEYSLAEVGLWPGRSSASSEADVAGSHAGEFLRDAPAVDCPIYFFVGRFDYNAPAQLTEAYYQKLVAPAGKQSGLVREFSP